MLDFFLTLASFLSTLSTLASLMTLSFKNDTFATRSVEAGFALRISLLLVYNGTEHDYPSK